MILPSILTNTSFPNILPFVPAKRTDILIQYLRFFLRQVREEEEEKETPATQARFQATNSQGPSVPGGVPGLLHQRRRVSDPSIYIHSSIYVYPSTYLSVCIHVSLVPIYPFNHTCLPSTDSGCWERPVVCATRPAGGWTAAGSCAAAEATRPRCAR